MATLNLYEMTSDALESEEVENMEDTEKQLYKVSSLIKMRPLAMTDKRYYTFCSF